jgi:ATP-dependent Lon protease
MREMRKHNFADAIDRFFKLGNNLNQRNVIAVRRTTSGLLKLLHPDGTFDKEAVRVCLTYALEVRRRIKEQLKKLGAWSSSTSTSATSTMSRSKSTS